MVSVIYQQKKTGMRGVRGERIRENGGRGEKRRKEYGNLTTFFFERFWQYYKEVNLWSIF